MIYKLTCTLVCFILAFQLKGQEIAYELDPKKNTTATYEELIQFYKDLASSDSRARLLEIGVTDVGKPLHLLVLSADGHFDPKQVKAANKAVLLINNGIHPGEPEGIDASMMFVRDILAADKLPENVVMCLIPVYNVAGMLNRGISRVNQNGPDLYGFRGSRQHYDLNRDFIKTDTRNSKLFQQIFQTWDPDVFLDTHTSNGADYQYIMTLIATQKDKLHPLLGTWMEETFTKPLYTRMEASNYPMIPYVNSLGETPESGLVGFLESGRYSTGYAALHHTIGYMPETHMWKPYAERVQSTYTLMNHLLELTASQQVTLIEKRRQVKEAVRQQTVFPITWQLNTGQVDSLQFLGYEAGHKESKVSGLQRLFYDRGKPTKIQIPYYNNYEPVINIEKPIAYIVPQAYDRVVDLLKINGVKLQPLSRDTTITVELYYITDYKTMNKPYEGHYLHHDVQVRTVQKNMQFFAGDLWVEMNQERNRYIVETLEPQAIDSFFNWNFFDAILSQKEYFSAYIFEEEAVRLLEENPEWKVELESERVHNSKFAQDGRAQLDWIYRKSPYYEVGHLLYPIARVR
ncbi:M14 family zinc carboxypeptidase [Sphingobacterium wenxiniae]|uniref:Zinc carboxypeptidase n=1 Tax=Sphingobacterium wenxiniae TaxID=683125 RepID=A0A1I6QFY7_9SPHI|nr:M14 family zinc carboxypeptidase [Sphingobacterium wenxiniae]SFS51198.1 Zinc carboxypeptidase [Sphingobacterium wenxiniae]